MKLRNLLYLVPLMLVGCDIVEFRQYEEITPGTVKVSPTSAEYSYAGGTTEITVNSATPWTVEFNKEEDAEWVNVNPASGQAGETKVTLTIKPFAPKDLSRDNIIKFVGKDGSVAGISFKQAWAEPKTEYVFHKATEIVDGRSYLIVADGHAAKPISIKNYGYLPVDSIVDEEGTVTLANKTAAWTFTAVDGGYTITGSDDKLIYQTGSYNSFNVSATRMDGDVWNVEFQEDGTAKIINKSMNKYMQFSTGYGTYGSYASAQDDGIVPVLYEEEVDPNAATLIPSTDTIRVAAGETEASFTINSGNDWVVESDAQWLKSYTERGSGEGDVTIQFKENTSFDDERVAEFNIYGSGIEAKVVLVQGTVEPFFRVRETEVKVGAYSTFAEINIDTNLPWEVECSEGLRAITEAGEGSFAVRLKFDTPNYTTSDIAYNVVVKTSSDRVETREYTVVVTHKTDIKIPVPYEYAFSDSFGEFSVEDVALPEGRTYVWSLDSQNKCLKASAYIDKKNYASESWIVSPTMDLSTLPATKACVRYAMNYGTPSLYSEQFYGLVIDGDEQTKINFKSVPSKGSWTVYTEEFDLSPWAGKNIRFALVYTSTEEVAGTFEIMSISFEEKTDRISEIFEKGTGVYTVVDAVVMAKSSGNVIINDGTGNIMLYKSNNDLQVGDVIALREAEVSEYNGLLQFNAPEYTKTGKQTPDYGEPVVLSTDDDIKNWAGEPQYQYIEFVGTMGTDNRNIKCGDYGVYIAKTTGYAGKKVKVLGYANGAASSYKTITTTLVSIEEVMESAKKYSVSFFGQNIKWNTALTVEGVDWVFSAEGGDGINSGSADLGKQFGTKSKPCTKLTLKGNYSEKVSKVTVESSCASNAGPKIDHVSVGGTVLTAPASVDLVKGTNTKFEFTSAAPLTGEVEIVWTSSASAGIYVKSVTLE